MEKVIKLDEDDVLSVDQGSPVGTPVFKVWQGVEGIVNNRVSNPSGWAEDGVECEVIGSKIGGWKKGRVRVCLEFIPDEPEPKPVEEPESPLDDLRQQVAQMKD